KISAAARIGVADIVGERFNRLQVKDAAFVGLERTVRVRELRGASVLRLFRDDVDHAPDGARSETRRGRAFVDFDALDLIGGDRGDVRRAAQALVLEDSVHIDGDLLRGGAADRDGGEVVRTAALFDLDAAQILQDFGDAFLAPLQLIGRDDGGE